MKKIKTKRGMLRLIRKDRPTQKIHEVEKFWINSLGFYTVSVDMESSFFGAIVEHMHIDLPYPKEEYNKLDEYTKTKYNFNEIN